MIVGLANHTILISKHGIETLIDDSASADPRCSGEHHWLRAGVFVISPNGSDTSSRCEPSKSGSESHFYSIGDAVIAADTEGRVTFLKPDRRKSDCGWTQREAEGVPLKKYSTS